MHTSIAMFQKFRIEIDNHKIALNEKEGELRAFVVVAGGQRVTAKNYWEIIVTPKKYAYNAKFYSSAVKILCRSLTRYGVDEVMELGAHPVRF